MAKTDGTVLDWLTQLAENTSMPLGSLRAKLKDAKVKFSDDAQVTDDLKKNVRAALRSKPLAGKGKLTLKKRTSSPAKTSSGPSVTVRARKRSVQKSIASETPEPIEEKEIELPSNISPEQMAVEAEAPIEAEAPAKPTGKAADKQVKSPPPQKPAPAKKEDYELRDKKPTNRQPKLKKDRNQVIRQALNVMNNDDSDGYYEPNRRKRKKLKGASTLSRGFEKPTQFIIKEVSLPESIMVSELAQKMSVKAPELIKSLMKMGVMATINQVLDQETASLVVGELGHKPRILSANAIEDDLVTDTEAQEAYEASARPPVVTIMGHVDHGKTSLLDTIRRAKVTESEAGGITQHIGAYQVALDKGLITFLDTPGHEAFSNMRARGAKCTDIVILVVAADDGVMPQTIEAIQHAKAAAVPIIVAINKMDKTDADPERVTTELSGHEVIPEDWGGDTIFCPISAKTGDGIDALLDAVLLQAEVLELKAPAQGTAKGVVIESQLDKNRGPIATILVQSGALAKGQIVLAGREYGRVRIMNNDHGTAVSEVGPSVPVEVIGLSGVPEAGDEVVVVKTERQARTVALFRQGKYRKVRLVSHATTLENLFTRLSDERASVINVILKADTQGSIEAISDALNKLSTDEVQVKFVAKGVGGMTESDINLAIASDAIVLGFNVRADAAGRRLAESESIDIRYYSVIYNLIDEVKSALSGLLKPERREIILGLATVREVFRSSKIGAIAGCLVSEGSIKRHCPIRVLRDNVVIYQGELESLRHFKEDLAEVRLGSECGIGVKDYNDVKVGDMIEVYEIQEIKRTLD